MSDRRRWWRSHKLMAAVICLYLVAAGLFVYALTGPSRKSQTKVSPVAQSQRPPSEHPQASSMPPTSTTITSAHAHGHYHHPRLAPATVMTKPSQSRAPKVPLNANAKAQPSGAAPDTGPDHGSGGWALGTNARASFAQLRTRLAGEGRIAVAVQPLGTGRLQVLGGSPAMPAMSTSKIFILSALLLDRGGVQNFTAEQKSLAQTAITESDNDSILALFGDLEDDKGGLTGASDYATDLLHRAGDMTTTVSTGSVPAGYATTFGQTPWTPAQEVTFFRALANGCLLPRADTDYVLGLMGQIVPSERWGLGSAGFTHVAFKGGWGPLAGGYGVRQSGIIGAGAKAVVVSIAADPATTFTTGQSVLDQIANWLRSEIRPSAHEAAPCPR